MTSDSIKRKPEDQTECAALSVSLQGSFIKPEKPAPSHRKIPLSLVRCDPSKDENACGLLQMAHSVPPEILYSTYWYRSGTNATMRKHLKGGVDSSIGFLPKVPERVLDIGCNDGKRIHIYGASTKGNVILQWCGIDDHIIDFAAERNPEKFDAMTLGTRIPIISEVESRAKNPDFYLVLPWHFREEIVKREREMMQKGTGLIFPLPAIEIIRASLGRRRGRKD